MKKPAKNLNFGIIDQTAASIYLRSKSKVGACFWQESFLVYICRTFGLFAAEAKKAGFNITKCVLWPKSKAKIRASLNPLEERVRLIPMTGSHTATFVKRDLA